jgi:hypothetical protein
MRFIWNSPTDIPDGAKTSWTWFAMWPVTIGNETRWLERVTVEYQWFSGYLYAEAEWIPKQFL